MSKRDYYEVLGVSKDATDDQLKRAYREKAKRFHPDRNPNDKSAEQKFKEVQEAYEVLKDKQKRTMYDQFGHAGFGAGTHAGEWRTAPGGQRVYTWSGGEAPGVDFGSIEDLLRNFGGSGGGFGDFIRGGGKRRATAAAPRADLDLHTDVTIPFEQAIHGATVDLQLTDGDGRHQTLNVKIPPGVRDGQTIRLRGKGSVSSDGQPGDVLLKVHVGPHPFFRREEDDIYLDVPLTIAEATLGAKVDVPTLDGKTTVTIPPGTASGTKLRLKDRGVRHGKSGQRGHQYLIIQIVPPKHLNPDQKSLFERLREAGESNPRIGAGW